jgi:hypothetical protein
MARKKSTEPNPGSPKNADDFKLIKGIGPALAARLHEASIITYRQLASLNPDELASWVNGLSAKQIAQQDWKGQARKLASKKSPPKSSRKAMVKKAVHQHYENFTLEFLVDQKHAVRRTRVAHIQSGDADTWAGWEATQLVDFLARHTGVRAPVERPEKQAGHADLNRDVQTRNRESQTTEPEIKTLPPPDTAAASHAIPVKETALPALQFLSVAPEASTLCIRKLEVLTPGSDHPVTFLRQDQPYLVRLTLDLTEVNDPGELPLIYKASVFSRQLGGTRYSIGEIVSTVKFSKSIHLDINGDRLPPGTYRLEALAEIRYDESTTRSMASLKGGLLQVH